MSNQLVISSGAKVRDLDGVLTATTGVVSSVPLGAANGVATLDSGGKVPVSQLPSSVVTYLGTWDASTNTPTLANGTGDAGDMYICNVAGTVNFGAGPITFAVGDWVLYGSGTWQKSNGQNGTVTSVAASITGNSIGITGSPITTAGTLAFAFAGNSSQYINGAGNLVTFPTITTSATRLITEVYNETGATLSKGTVVYINGGHGNLPTVTKALATGDATSAQTYGVVQSDITDNNNGYVVVIGSLSDLDTQAYPDGTQLYLSGTTAGAWTSTKPYAPIHLVYVGIVTRSHPTQGVVEIKIQNGYELNEIHDVSITSVANNDGLFYDSATSLWKNKTIAAVLGYTPANDALVVKLAGTQTITGEKTFTNVNGTQFDYGIISPLTSRFDQGIIFKKGTVPTIFTNITTNLYSESTSNNLIIQDENSKAKLVFNNSTQTYTFPAASGTIALTSDLTGGTVTSVALSAPTGFSVTGSPVTTSGTLALAFASGYSLPTNVKQSNWDDAYTWVAAFPTQTGNSGKFLTTDGSTLSWAANPLGTVTSVAMTVPTGLSVSGSPITTSGTLAVTLTAGYSIPTTAKQTEWDTAYTNRITSATSPLYISSNVISISQASASSNGYLSSTDWSTFNGKIGGGGTANYIPKFSGTSSIADSIIYDNSGKVLINTTDSSIGHRLAVYSATEAAQLRVMGAAPSVLFTDTANASYTYSAYLGIVTSANNFFTGSAAGNYAIVNNTSNPIVFAINSSLKMTLNASGNLSIGNTNDTFKLDVTGTGRFTSSIRTDASIAFLNTTSGGTAPSSLASYSQLYFDSYQLMIRKSDNQTVTLRYPSTAFSQTYDFNVEGYLAVQANVTLTTGSVFFGNSVGKIAQNNSNFFWDNTNLRLGIGTASPAYTLDVNGTGRFSGNLTLGSTTTGVNANIYSSSYGSNGLFQAFGTDGNLKLQMGGLGTNEAFFYTGSGNKLTFYSGGAVSLTLASTGAATFSSSVTAGTGIFNGTGYSVITNSAYLQTPNSVGLSFGYNRSGGNGESTIVYGAPASGFNFEIASVTSGTITPRLTITNAGNVGIGTSSPDSLLEVSKTDGIITQRGGTGYSIYRSYAGDGTTANLVEFQIRNRVDGSNMVSIGNYSNHDLTFRTNNTEKMRILSGGAVCIGVTSAYGSNLLNVNGGIYATSSIAAVVASDIDMFVFQNTGATYTKAAVVASIAATGGTGSYFFYGQQSTSTVALKIFSNGNIQNTNNSYGAISDARLKENITDATPKLEDLMKVKVRNYNLKGESNKQLGVISQELEEIFPNMIEESTNLGENMKIKGVKYSVFVPMLIKAVQELKQELETLKNK